MKNLHRTIVLGNSGTLEVPAIRRSHIRQRGLTHAGGEGVLFVHHDFYRSSVCSLGLGQSLLAIDRFLKEFRVDLGNVINDSDLKVPCADQAASSVLEEKLRTIERITGHPLAMRDRRYTFAQWSLENPINDLLFPADRHVTISESSNLAELPISGGTLVICQRIEPKPVITEWHNLIMNYPLDCFFSSDASIFPKDLSWIALFCHGDYGVFARRELGVTV